VPLLHAEKLALPPFTYLQMDTRDLSDIPNYRHYIWKLGLPCCQFTIRDCTTGAQFLGYAPEATVHYATLTARRVLKHIQQCGVALGLGNCVTT